MKSALTLLLLLAAIGCQQNPPPRALAKLQPGNVMVAMDEHAAPEMKAKLVWDAVAGSTSYNLYKKFNQGGTNTSCPSWAGATPFTTVQDNGAQEYSYLDDPAPGLWQMPEIPAGAWRVKEWWCYGVSAVVAGVESPVSQPQAIAVADDFYVTLRYQTACTGTIKVVMPYPYLNGQVVAHFYWTDSSGLDHEFQVTTLYNSFGQPQPYNQEWEGRWPAKALDGTTIPWQQNPKTPGQQSPYYGVITTPDGGSFQVNLAPAYNSDASYYQNIELERVQGVQNCPVPAEVPGGDLAWWQNVAK